MSKNICKYDLVKRTVLPIDPLGKEWKIGIVLSTKADYFEIKWLFSTDPFFVDRIDVINNFYLTKL